MGVYDVLGKKLDEGGRKSDGTIERDAIQSIATSLDKIATKLDSIEEVLISINRQMRLK